MPKFLTLSTEVSEPFVIPNVSPVSSPKVEAVSATYLPGAVSPLLIVEEAKKENDEDATLISTRSMSTIELN